MNSLLKSACCAAYLCATGAASYEAIDPLEVNIPRAAPREEFQSKIEQKDWGAAVQAAEALVASVRQSADKDPMALADALAMLGAARYRNADFSGAEATFTEALNLIEQHEGAASHRTLTPLRGLGFSFAARDRHEQAIPYLDRALLISHRTNGLFDVRQQPILEQLANSLTKINQALDAERHVNYMLHVGERAYGKDDPRLVPVMCSVGDWNAAVGYFDIARRHYRDAIRLVEKKLGENDPAVVLPLRRLAYSYIQELDFRAKGLLDPEEMNDPEQIQMNRRPDNPRYISTDGQRALQRALKILKSDANASPQLLLETLVEMGDWYQVKQDTAKALDYYGQAAQTFAQVAAKGDAKSAQDPLAFPVRVYFPVPSPIARSYKMALPDSEEVYVQMELTVTSEGLVEQAKVIDSSAYPRNTSEILQAIKDARFRPKFVNGAPVEVTAFTFREVFRRRKRAEDSEENPS
jgi:TonB family protein